MKRILIVKFWALGDILMATPLLRALKSKWPDCEITWLADKDCVGILSDNPLLHDVIAFDSGAWRRHWRSGRFVTYLWMSLALRRDLKHRRFDIVMTLTAEKWWALWFNVAPVRVGLFPDARFGWLGRHYTHAVAETQSRSVRNTDRYLVAASALGCPVSDTRMVIGRPSEEHYVQSLLDRGGYLGAGPVVILAPFSTGRNRCWEPERYTALIGWLRSALNATCVLTLGSKDGDAARRIAAEAGGAATLAAGATLPQYIALVQRADLVICSDSSAMHVAGAAGTPYIALFGPTPPASRAPIGGGLCLSKPLPCAPCDSPSCRNPVFRQCMKLLEVEDVQRAVLALLKTSAVKEVHEHRLTC